MTATPPTKASLWRRSWPPLFLAASALFVIWHFREDGERVAQMGPPDKHWLALALLLQLAYMAINTLCWRSTIRWYAGTGLTWLMSFRQLMMAALGKYFPGKVWGMIARADSLQQAGVPLRRSALATINEQCLLLYGSFLVCALAWLAIQPSASAAAVAGLACAGLFLLPKLQGWILGLGLVRRILNDDMSDAGGVLTSWQILFLVACYSAIWIISGLTISALYYAIFGGTPSLSMLAHLIIANTIGISIGFFAIFSPGGLGVREFITGGLLASQIGTEPAIVLCLVFRLWIVAFELLGGLSLLMRDPNSAESRKREN